MKNILIIDIDTERSPVVKLSKTEGSGLPKNPDEAKDVIIKDMACITEALCTLINAADQSNFKTTEESIGDVIMHLERGTGGDEPIEAEVTVTEMTDEDTIDKKSE